MNSCEICLPVPMSKSNFQAHVVRLANLGDFLSLGRVLLGAGTSSSARHLGPDRLYWATPGLGAGADKDPHRYSIAVFTCGQMFFSSLVALEELRSKNYGSHAELPLQTLFCQASAAREEHPRIALDHLPIRRCSS